jgi:hypothetical protein
MMHLISRRFLKGHPREVWVRRCGQNLLIEKRGVGACLIVLSRFEIREIARRFGQQNARGEVTAAERAEGSCLTKTEPGSRGEQENG